MRLGGYFGGHCFSCLRWDETDDAAPSETDAAEVEEAHVEVVGPLLDPRKDFGVVFWDVVGDLLLYFLWLAVAVVHDGEVGILLKEESI